MSSLLFTVAWRHPQNKHSLIITLHGCNCSLVCMRPDPRRAPIPVPVCPPSSHSLARHLQKLLRSASSHTPFPLPPSLSLSLSLCHRLHVTVAYTHKA